MRGVNDNPEPHFGGSFMASTIALLLPALVVIAGYSALLAALWMSGRSGGALARLCMVVLGLGGPFLVAHALMRRLTIRVDLLPKAAYLQSGFPSGGPIEAHYDRIRSVGIVRGLVGRLTGTGTLVVDIADAGRVSVACLADAAAAAVALEREVSRARAIAAPYPRAAGAARRAGIIGPATHF